MSNEMKQIMEVWRKSLQEKEVLGVRIPTEEDVLAFTSEQERQRWAKLKKSDPGKV